MESSSSTIVLPSCLSMFGLHLYELTRNHIVSRTMQGTVSLINFIFWFYFCIFLGRFSGLVWPFFLIQQFCVVGSTVLVGFLSGCDPSPLFLNISPYVFSHLHISTISLRLLAANFNPCTSSWFFHSHRRDNLTSWIILSSGNPWSILNGGKCSIYSTILFKWHIKLHILESWELNKQQNRYLFWCQSDFGGNNWVARISMTKF